MGISTFTTRRALAPAMRKGAELSRNGWLAVVFAFVLALRNQPGDVRVSALTAAKAQHCIDRVAKIFESAPYSQSSLLP